MRRRFTCGSWSNRNNVWSCKFPEHIRLPDGSFKVVVRRKSFPGLSERAAKAAMASVLDAVNTANKAEAQHVFPKNERTLNDLITEWRKLVASNRKPRGLQTTESHLKAHIVPELGDVPLSHLDAHRVQEFVHKITPGRSGKMVLNIVTTLTGILLDTSKWPDFKASAKPVRVSDLSLPLREKAKPRFLTGKEIKKLIKASRGILRTILIVLALTGMRINEVLGLRVEDVDFQNKVIHVRKSAYKGKLGTPKSDASAA